jgi:hypothetical protein
MSRTYRGLDAEWINWFYCQEEDYTAAVKNWYEVHGDNGAITTSNAPKHFRQALNKSFRMKAKEALILAVKNDDNDEIVVAKRNALWYYW